MQSFDDIHFGANFGVFVETVNVLCFFLFNCSPTPAPPHIIYTNPILPIRDMRMTSHLSFAGMFAQVKRHVSQFCLAVRHNTETIVGVPIPPPTGLYPEPWDHPTKTLHRYSASRRYRLTLIPLLVFMFVCVVFVLCLFVFVCVFVSISIFVCYLFVCVFFVVRPSRTIDLIERYILSVG